MQVPKQYTALKTMQPMTIDGDDNEAAWNKAPWSDNFVDIEGDPSKRSSQSTRFKLLWDNDYLYVFARFEEEHIWANLKDHDLPIFQDNAFEIFIDPEGDTQNYVEFQINAFSTVWDLLLTKAPRSGGASITDWDIKGLKKAVSINGTLNNPNDIDKFWNIELAIPHKTFRFGGANSMPKAGNIWKMNLTRVQRTVEIKDGKYIKKINANGRPLNPEYTCWSPQGILNFHYPERWGYVRFADEIPDNLNFLNPELEELKLKIWKYFYLQQDFKTRNGKYALNIEQLKKQYPDISFENAEGIKISATNSQFNLELESSLPDFLISLDHDGKFLVKRN
ncbi:carbohydrate-binding family 9-like protein [Daejeonella rubra]|nr:carbohydrate-binding family 9-like protein [Daejeonella rubra]